MTAQIKSIISMERDTTQVLCLKRANNDAVDHCYVQPHVLLLWLAPIVREELIRHIHHKKLLKLSGLLQITVHAFDVLLY